MSGTLFVVATPIGNLSDLTERAKQTLFDVDAVAAEDTRRTRALLSHLGISGKPLFKLDAYATEATLERCLSRLAEGERIALVTDAGTPSVSDPGTALVRRAADRAIGVVAIPGPSAVTTAVAVSGLVDGPFLFCGFLPRKGEKRRAWIERFFHTAEPIVLFEAPGRTAATLSELALAMPSRPACVARELTKLHEQVLRGTLAELAQGPGEYRGEVTVVLGSWQAPPTPQLELDVPRLIVERLEAGVGAKAIARELAEKTELSRRDAYQAVLDVQVRKMPGP